MADIKTRDAVKGTIKTIDKAAIASERMKNAYAKTKDKAEQGYYTEGNSLPSMLLIRFPILRRVSQQRVSVSLISRDRKVSRRPERISVRQRINFLILKRNGR